MTTFDDDYLRLELHTGTRDIPCHVLGFSWPPPERVTFGHDGLVPWMDGDKDEFVLERVSYSQITDDQRNGMTHVCRGALYRYVANS